MRNLAKSDVKSLNLFHEGFGQFYELVTHLIHSSVVCSF